VARVDYFAIEEAFQEILEDDAELQGVRVKIEEELSFEFGDVVLIDLESRDAPPDQQTLSAGQRTRYNLLLSFWCYGAHLEVKKASEKRDDLTGKVEIALMKHMTIPADSPLEALVNGFWLLGGDFETRQEATNGRFFSGAQIQVNCDVTAISV
jgi:hypothetical protein